MSKRGKATIKAPVYDDWGNLVGGGPGLSMADAEQALKQGQRVGAMIVPTERIVERKQGCWNCTKFDATEVYILRVRDAFRRDVKVFLGRGHSLQRAGEAAAITRDLLLSKRGHFGLCLAGATDGDFVACKHLCGKWSGRTGVTGSFAPGEAYDPLVEEVVEVVGDGVPVATTIGEKEPS